MKSLRRRQNNNNQRTLQSNSQRTLQENSQRIFGINPEYPTFNILLTKAEKGMLHEASITDVDELVGYLVCPYCKQQVYNLRSDPKRKKQPQFNRHVDECKKNSGLLEQKVQFTPRQLPYAPHITKQKIYQWLLHHIRFRNPRNIFRRTSQ